MPRSVRGVSRPTVQQQNGRSIGRTLRAVGKRERDDGMGAA
ncbi:MAG: hypothetical protein QOH57_3688 [Mycobacterium sp.]|jgi:hypothetical protein|nr:hypothetical protein [Mycobacterium sp.]